MDIHTATEEAYKKGYEDGKRDSVVHGRWIERQRPTKHLVCTACICKNHMRVKSPYCPNCGAKMDLEI